MTSHFADQPSWDCVTCGRPWPCEAAKNTLRANFTPTRLAMYACARLVQAAHDMPDATPAELYVRFLSWTGTPPNPPDPA